MTAVLSVTVPVAAPVDVVFAAMVDLPSQERWMVLTRLYPVESAVAVPEVGSRIAALTGLGGMGVLDTMTVTVFEPPHRWETEHTGNAFKGKGIFRVEPGPTGSLVTWVEEVELPFGIFGRVGWLAARPVVRWGLTASLRRLAAGVTDGSLPVTATGPAD